MAGKIASKNVPAQRCQLLDEARERGTGDWVVVPCRVDTVRGGNISDLRSAVPQKINKSVGDPRSQGL